MFPNADDLQARTRALLAESLKLQAEIAEEQMAWTRETLFSGLDLARRSADLLGHFWMNALLPTDKT